ncbi:MAG: ABC transporter ATP-binding protein [Oscillospiraceae bacterium]|nr:ABC transporter ATP-binding protein [Oscillospiraceae bacterium]
MNIIEVKDLSLAYEDGPRVLDGLSFTAEEGEALVFAGLSGSGKTTLCSCLCGILPRTEAVAFSGSVTVDGVDIPHAPLHECAQHIALVFQNPDDQLVCTAVEDELAFGLENLCVPPEEIRRRVDGTMAEFGLSGMALSDPAKLSGGQKKLVTIASTLILGPRVIVLDEPMTGLDAESRELVLNAVKRLLERGCTVVAVEHDLSLAPYADRILYLRDGKLHDKP